MSFLRSPQATPLRRNRPTCIIVDTAMWRELLSIFRGAAKVPWAMDKVSNQWETCIGLLCGGRNEVANTYNQVSGDLRSVPDVFDIQIIVQPLGASFASIAAGFDAAKGGFGH